MTDERHDDASQEGSLQQTSSSTDPETNRTLEAKDNPGAEAGGAADHPQPAADHPAPPRAPSRVLSVVIAAVAGAIAAGLVVGGARLTGWSTLSSGPQVTTAEFSDLSNRVDRVEFMAKKAAAPAPDPAAAGRIDALEKSVASLRGELDATRGESEKLAAALKDVKSAQAGAPAHEGDGGPDLAAVNTRLADLEQKTQTLAEAAKDHATPSDDVPLRRAVAATLLKVSVQQEQPYGDLLTAAKGLVADPDTLKPLKTFADTGVPSPDALCRELLAIAPKLSPTPVMATTGGNIVDRLQEGAARLVHIERLDAPRPGESAGAVVSRITSAARRNDLAAARKELKSLPAGDRSVAEAWIAKADARDAALAASRQFAAEAMAALTKPAP
jgi:hypothetical protein